MRPWPHAALAAAIAGTTLAGAPQQPWFRANADLVSVYATVVDRSGRLVTDLTAGDFEIFDNGRLQPISLFVSERQPIAAVIMLDRSASMEDYNDLVLAAAGAFVTYLGPGDRARIGTFGREVSILPQSFTDDREELRRILRADLPKGGPTPLWEAASAAVSALAGEPGRRVVLLFSDGRNSPAFLDTEVGFDDVRERARRGDVMVYAIGLGSPCTGAAGAGPSQRDDVLFQRGGRGRGGLPPPPTFPGVPIGPGGIRLPPRGGSLPPSPRRPSMEEPARCRPEAPDPALRQLAADGGGGYFQLDRAGDLIPTFSQVAAELHHQYLLAFAPQSSDGEVHDLRVEVKRAGASVRARTSYVAPGKPPVTGGPGRPF
jgi:VWFA-related protein